MPVICSGRIVPQQQKRRNPPMGNRRPNRGDIITNPTRVLITPINRLSHLSLGHRNRTNPNPRLRNRSDRRPKIPLPTPRINRTSIALIQGNLPAIRPITRRTIAPIILPIPNPTPPNPIPIRTIGIDRIPRAIKPIIRLHRPTNRRPRIRPMGTPPIPPRPGLNPP